VKFSAIYIQIKFPFAFRPTATFLAL